MRSGKGDSFWFGVSAWRHSLIEGVRAAAIVFVTISVVWSLGWLFHTDQNLASWLSDALLVGFLTGLPFLPTFAIWTHCDVWRGNQVKPK